MRPVISDVSAPNRQTAEKVNSMLRNYSTFVPKYGVKNSSELAKKPADLIIPGKCNLISFDVGNLFTRVQCKEAVLPAEANDEQCSKIDTCCKELFYV
jgi:hypothetical protein